MFDRYRMLAAASGLAALAFLGAACGGADGAGAGGATGGRTGADSRFGTHDQQLRLARCMRDNGIEMADPKPGQEGVSISVGGKDTDPGRIQEAMRKCRTRVGLPEAPSGPTQEEKDKALKFARCMREHGIDMPDPKFDKSAQPAIRPGGDTARFERAMKECNAR
ncbi:hypothetical protein [Actinomadura kijaniata]|uniref:hypothetical protein n=1 Tax=Actinomadura kijaniata TaxID=46161 RepID=UPI0008334061|nr:hypothetical protein [Actinomadura kijaniata]